MSQFDLSTPVGLAVFLAMQQAALDALIAADGGDRTRSILPDLAARAADDLATLGATPAPQRPALGTTPDAMAVDYVLLGSRLGTAVLKKRWSMATDERVHAASAYFSAPTYIDVWQAFCSAAAEVPADSPQAQTIVNDTSRLFDFYHGCAVAAHKDLATAYA
ncbi:hypothetical protein [Pseudooceanicola sp. MF1-13]|uniref:hypothetical protein n=1 Tax=Pseudooceanicola sp. MF1-13 TaxID=3379095 RepID=UPI00389272F9